MRALKNPKLKIKHNVTVRLNIVDCFIIMSLSLFYNYSIVYNFIGEYTNIIVQIRENGKLDRQSLCGLLTIKLVRERRRCIL